jgi:tetratricopeptide (TPR) repeat protein
MATGRQVGRYVQAVGISGLCGIAVVVFGLGGAQAQKPKSSPSAETPSAETRSAKVYADCMALARSEPKKAIGVAAKWERDGGDEGARHCSAVALLNTGEYEEAARRLESLAATTRRPGKTIKAELLAQAGQAWLIAGKITEALSAQTRALGIAGPQTELLLDRAITRASIGDYWEAIDDLNRAIDKDPARSDALVLRATAWRKLKNIDLANDDIMRAVTISPTRPDTYLERGNIRLLRGDPGGAGADWRKVIDLDAKSPAADAARDNLSKLKAP